MALQDARRVRGRPFEIKGGWGFFKKYFAYWSEKHKVASIEAWGTVENKLVLDFL